MLLVTLLALHNQIDVDDVENLVQVGSAYIVASSSFEADSLLPLHSNSMKSLSANNQSSMNSSDLLVGFVSELQVDQSSLKSDDSSLIVSDLDVVSVDNDGLLNSNGANSSESSDVSSSRNSDSSDDYDLSSSQSSDDFDSSPVGSENSLADFSWVFEASLNSLLVSSLDSAESSDASGSSSESSDSHLLQSSVNSGSGSSVRSDKLLVLVRSFTFSSESVVDLSKSSF